MNGRGLFRSFSLNQIDAAKGRVSIPAGMRATIEANSGAKFLLLAKHEQDPCLIGYDREYSTILQAQLEERERAERQAGRAGSRHNINRAAFGIVEEVGFDTSGRFILPSFLRKKARLDDLAFFIGTGDYFEIWNPHVLLETESVGEDTKELVRDLLSERAA